MYLPTQPAEMIRKRCISRGLVHLQRLVKSHRRGVMPVNRGYIGVQLERIRSTAKKIPIAVPLSVSLYISPMTAPPGTSINGYALSDPLSHSPIAIPPEVPKPCTNRDTISCGIVFAVPTPMDPRQCSGRP